MQAARANFRNAIHEVVHVVALMLGATMLFAALVAATWQLGAMWHYAAFKPATLSICLALAAAGWFVAWLALRRRARIRVARTPPKERPR